MTIRWRLLGALLLLCATQLAGAADIRPVDDAWRAALPLDPAAATQAYLDRIPPELRARSNAYAEGEYALQLADLLLTFAISALLLFTPWSTRWRDHLRQRLRRPVLADAAFALSYLLVSSVLAFPLTVYSGFVREHAYGMATQDIGEWLGEFALQLGLSAVLGALAVALLYVVLRAAGRQWWLWGTLAMSAVMTVMVALSPVYIAPLFNSYTPMAEGPLKQRLLQMAQANGVPVDNVQVMDASRQTTRVSAHVTGLFGTAAVRLNDNLLKRSSPEEVAAVMGHEIGHYAMNHVPKMLVGLGLLIAAGFAFSDWLMRRLLARHGGRWQVTGVSDIGGLPLLVATFSLAMYLATPLHNTMVRTQETEADLWGLNLAREPLAEAEVLLKLVQYRKAEPGALEEAVFFHHPSARTRIFHAMRWRAQMAASAPQAAASAPH